jgi:hypothetical protein
MGTLCKPHPPTDGSPTFTCESWAYLAAMCAFCFAYYQFFVFLN